MEIWKRTEPTTVTKVGWRTIVTKTFILPDGSTDTFGSIGAEGQDFVAVIGLTPENEVIIARQFRFGPEKIYEELPGGYVDDGETPEIAVKRELMEETGYKVGTVDYLGAYHKDAYMNGLWHVFWATDCVRVADQQLESGEFVEVDLISVDQLIKNSKSDKMTDTTAVLMAYDKFQQVHGV